MEKQDRTLESIAILFMPKSPFNWDAEKSWREHVNGDILALDDGIEGDTPVIKVAEKSSITNVESVA